MAMLRAGDRTVQIADGHRRSNHRDEHRGSSLVVLDEPGVVQVGG